MPRPTRPPRPALMALLLALLLALTACGDSSSGDTAEASGSDDGQWPVTVTGDNGELTLDEQPQTIVSMSASATEMLFAIGAGDQVEAVDSTSNYPEDAPTTDLSAFTPNAEAIAGYDPDLVVLSDDLNGIVDALDALKVPTLLLGAAQDLDDTYAQLDTLGEATGHADEADDVAADMQDRIKAAVDSVPAEAKGARSTTSSTRPSTPPRAARSSAASTRCSAWRTSPTAQPMQPAATRSCPPSTSSARPRTSSCWPTRSAATRAQRRSPSARRSTRCPPSRTARCSPRTTTSPRAGARGSPTSPSSSPTC